MKGMNTIKSVDSHVLYDKFTSLFNSKNVPKPRNIISTRVTAILPCEHKKQTDRKRITMNNTHIRDSKRFSRINVHSPQPQARLTINRMDNTHKRMSKSKAQSISFEAIPEIQGKKDKPSTFLKTSDPDKVRSRPMRENFLASRNKTIRVSKMLSADARFSTVLGISHNEQKLKRYSEMPTKRVLDSQPKEPSKMAKITSILENISSNLKSTSSKPLREIMEDTKKQIEEKICKAMMQTQIKKHKEEVRSRFSNLGGIMFMAKQRATITPSHRHAPSFIVNQPIKRDTMSPFVPIFSQRSSRLRGTQIELTMDDRKMVSINKSASPSRFSDLNKSQFAGMESSNNKNHKRKSKMRDSIMHNKKNESNFKVFKKQTTILSESDSEDSEQHNRQKRRKKSKYRLKKKQISKTVQQNELIYPIPFCRLSKKEKRELTKKMGFGNTKLIKYLDTRKRLNNMVISTRRKEHNTIKSQQKSEPMSEQAEKWMADYLDSPQLHPVEKSQPTKTQMMRLIKERKSEMKPSIFKHTN